MFEWKGTLLHLTHYDPAWLKKKPRERYFHRPTMEACIDAAAQSGLNLVLFDIKDAVRYKSLPECRQPFSVPMKELKELAARARKSGLEVIPKLNFSRSTRFRHSTWIWPSQKSPDSPADWKKAFAAVDEVVAAVKPRFLHVGMDEDDTRSPEEYKRALTKLHRGLKKRGLRMVMWAEVGHNWRAQQRWKEIPAIKELPRDVILMPWCYGFAQTEWTRKLKRWGFEVIGACGYGTQKGSGPLRNAKEWTETIEKSKAEGLVLTQWIPCRPVNRKRLLKGITEFGKFLAKH